MFEFVGIREMGHQGDVADALDRPQALVGGRVLVGLEAEPVHAGVHFEVDVDRAVELGVFQHLDLLDRVDRAVDIVLGQQRDVAGVEDAFQQQDRFHPPQFAQAQGVLGLDQGQAVGAHEAFHAALQAMAIGIRLDDGPDPGLGAQARARARLCCIESRWMVAQSGRGMAVAKTIR
jgi:hypothetical protein